jgi:putative MFS transporter
MSNGTAGAGAGAGADMNAQHIAARIERLPVCSWHTKMRLIISTAWFFDAFDLLAIAFVLPVLIGMWKLNPGQIGTLIGIGFAGQLIGAIVAGWMAERWGRIPVAIGTLLIFTLMSFACAFAGSYESLLWMRFFQGLGIGGEVPVMHAYMNEFAKAERRGRFSLGMQVLFAVGLFGAAVAGVWVVPTLGWQWMFIIGGIPALLAIPLRSVLPESPRWLASKGRFEEADRALKRIEDIAVKEGKPLPPIAANLPVVQVAITRFSDLFKGIYLRRTLTIWAMWMCTYFITYGLTAWAPSLFRTVYKLPVQESLNYGFILNGVGVLGALLTVFIIDITGRKKLFIAGLLLGSLPLLWFFTGQQMSAQEVIVLISLSFFFLTFNSLGMGMYTAENYPNHMRALGGGIASAWQRLASMIGPLVVGAILPLGGINAVFGVFGIVALTGAVICAVFAIETSGKVLEELSPAPQPS